MDLTQLKTQVLTMFMVQPASSQKNIYDMMYTMLIVNCVEYVFRNAPHLWALFTAFMKQYAGKKTQFVQFIPDVKTKDTVYAVTLLRTYEKGKTEENKYIEKVDSIIEYICNVQNITHVKLDRRYMINTKDEIQITPHITAKVGNITLDDKGEIGSIELTIYSTVLRINELREWIDEVHRNYCYEKNNKLGNRRFFFNEIPMPPQKQINLAKGKKDVKEEYNWTTAPKQLLFTMNEFKTSKSFTNVFGSHVTELKDRIELFMRHPDWYAQRGIPYSLGILLHGIPGAGKTSTIKAIAKDTGRHIFNISLREYTTQKQLVNLFFNETVSVMTETTQQTYAIPLNQRIYVIEDIDCLTNVVLDRGLKMPLQENGEGITLSFILNLLDGILETPGRILVITSNYPEKLDKALIRPGRIDIKIQFDNATRELIKEMIENFYDIRISNEDVPAGLDCKISPAEVLESLCTNYKSHVDAVQHMLQKVCVAPCVPCAPCAAELPQTEAACAAACADSDSDTYPEELHFKSSYKAAIPYDITSSNEANPYAWMNSSLIG
jgi:ATP-dependent Zn protease